MSSDGPTPLTTGSAVLHLTLVGDGSDDPKGPHFGALADARHALQRLGVPLADHPADADVVVVFETAAYKTRRYAATLAAATSLHPHLHKTVCYNMEDCPHGIFPGLYASLPRQKFDPRIHRACTYLGEYNGAVATVATENVDVRYLFSFRGHPSAPVRRELFRRVPSRPDAPVEQSNNWFDHTPDQKLAYARDLAASAFVLCPRGQATSSFRLYEAMQLGRAPVILSDDWVPPPGPDWIAFALFVPEDRVADLPDLLRARAAQAPAMGRLARLAWESHFSPDARYRRFAHDAAEIQIMRPGLSDGHADPARWQSKELWNANGWSLHQRLAAMAKRRTGSLASKVARPLRTSVSRRERTIGTVPRNLPIQDKPL